MPRGYGPTVLPLLAWQGSRWCLSFPVCVEGDVGYQPSCGSVWGAEVKGATDETAHTVPLLPARAALGGDRFGFTRGWVGKAQPCGQHRVGQRSALESPTPRGLPRHCSAPLHPDHPQTFPDPSQCRGADPRPLRGTHGHDAPRPLGDDQTFTASRRPPALIPPRCPPTPPPLPPPRPPRAAPPGDSHRPAAL